MADYFESKPKYQRLRKTEAVWLACAIDSEGTISVSHDYSDEYKEGVNLSVGISVINTNHKYCERAAEIMLRATKYGNLGKYIRINQYQCGISKKPIYSVHIRNKRDVLWLLGQLYPYLIVKQEKAREAIDILVTESYKPHHKKLSPIIIKRVRDVVNATDNHFSKEEVCKW